MKNRTGSILLALGALACAAGCATTYRYATGQQAELLEHSSMLAPWYAFQHIVASPPPAPSTDPGVSYEIVTGQSQARLRAQLGAPRAVTADPAGRGNETWEYPFGVIRFRQGRVADVTFATNAPGTSYYEKTTRFLWP